MYSFKNLKSPKHLISGIAEKVLFAPVSWFAKDGIKSPGVFMNYGDGVIIKESHIFLPQKGFIECSLAPEKNNYDAKTIGDTGFQKFSNELKVVLPGSYEQQHETIKNLLNTPVIVLVKDIDCSEDMWYQVGSSCIYAYVSADFSTGTTKDGTKSYQLTITNIASSVLLYEGNVILQSSLKPVAIIKGEINGDIVLLNCEESLTIGGDVYEYEVLYNDINDNLQTLILPGNLVTNQFNTDTLINWDGEGFAVSVKLTDDGGSDTTLVTDDEIEQPYIAGSFDQGFNEGFDFNIP